MKPEKSILFLVNPISGTGNKELLRNLISSKMTGENIIYQIQETSRDGDYSDVSEKILRGEITDVIICGGDGTVSQAIASLRHTSVNFGIIPMGSGNGLAFAAGIPYAPKKAIDVALTCQPSRVDAFSVNGKFSCMLSGVGIDAAIAHDFATEKKRGLITYIKKSFRHYLLSKPYHFVVEMENFKLNTEAYFISIANSNQFGNHVTIAPMASLSDGLLDIVIVNRMNKIALLYQIARHLKLGKVMHPADVKAPSGISYFQCKNIRIRNTGRAPVHIDGEPAETSEWLEVNIIENAFSLIKP